MSAVENRRNAVRIVMDHYVSPTGVRLLADTVEVRTELADLIYRLKPLGRTERWESAITRWAAMVNNPDNPLDWAMLQGHVYAGLAAM